MTVEHTTVSWIVDTVRALENAKNVSELHREFSDLEDVESSLTDLLAEFETLAEGAAVVRPLGWPGRQALPNLKGDLAQAVEGLARRPLNRSIRSLESFGSDVRANLTLFWRQHTSERMDSMGELQTLVATLGRVGGITELSTRVHQVFGQLARTQSTFPTQQAADLLQDAGLILRQIEESLRPESVRQFLSAAIRGGASLDLLTDEVLDWLQSHNAARSFRVVAGTPIDVTNG